MRAHLALLSGLLCASLLAAPVVLAEDGLLPRPSTDALALAAADARASTDGATRSSPSSSMINPAANPLSLAMFYHPPRDGTSLTTVVQRFSSAVLTHGDERYRDQMRAAGFAGPVLQYLVANEASGPAGLNRGSDPCGSYTQSGNDVSGIARDFCSALHRDEGAFLHNGRGERLYSTLSWTEQTGKKTRYYYLMNPESANWQAYFARHAATNVRSMGYSGLFLDNIDRSLERGKMRSVNSDGVVAEFASDDLYRAAIVEYLGAIRRQVGDAPIWANVTSSYHEPFSGDRYLPYLDGVMNEFFAAHWSGRYAGPTAWEQQLRQAEHALREGRSFVAVAQGERGDRERFRFALGSYLLVSQPGAYFRYADDSVYDEAWLFDDYQTRLGQPLGERYQRHGQWRRDFMCGSVQVDPAAQTAVIQTDRQLGCI